jgi:hypothetical protein
MISACPSLRVSPLLIIFETISRFLLNMLEKSSLEDDLYIDAIYLYFNKMAKMQTSEIDAKHTPVNV